MCAASNTPMVQPSTSTTKPVPKWMKMKQQNRSSAEKNAKPIVKKSSSAQKPNDQSRNAKRARWAKKAKPVAKPIRVGPTLEYISACCSVPARKPKAGAKETGKDAETGKTKEMSKGLGKWTCGQCQKKCKVTPRKPEAKVVTIDMAAIEQKVVAEIANE